VVEIEFADDLLSERRVAPSTNCQRGTQFGQDSIQVSSSRCGRNLVCGMVKGERSFRESRRVRAHVPAHLSHLLGVPELAGRCFGRDEVGPGRGRDDGLHTFQMLAHALLLVMRHHREEPQRGSIIQLGKLAFG
jgi:hypothetical protein